MRRREDEVRERHERQRDIMRGLGQAPSLGDMRAWQDELNYAALEDGMDRTCPACEGTGGGQYNDCPHCDGNGVI